MNKKNFYIFSTVLFILISIFLHLDSFGIDSIFKPGSGADIQIDQAKLLQSGPFKIMAFVLMMLFYLSMLLTGGVNLVIYVVRRLRRKPFMEQTGQVSILFLPAEKVCKLFFLSVSFLVSCQVLILLLRNLQFKMDYLAASLMLNLLFELWVVYAVIKYLTAKWLNFTFKTENLLTAVKIYSLVVISVLITGICEQFIMSKLGIRTGFSPVMKFSLLLKSKFSMALIFLEIIIFAPLAEELFFRGFIYKLFRRKYAFLISSLLSSVLFSLLHLDVQNLLPILVVGVFLCYAYEKTQNILTPIMLHSIFNFFNYGYFLLIKDFIKK